MESELSTRAARLFTVGFHGQTVSADLSRLLARGVGGVVFFARNVGEPAEVAAATHAIKRHVARRIPIALDQEGGKVARLRRGFTELPPMRAVGELGSPNLAHELGALIGRELRAVGFDMNYAPVLDVDTNPDNPVIGSRSFGRTPELVGELGVALAAGLESAGVAACGKHFPGHGDTHQDSHLTLPRLLHSLERLKEIELRPFARAISAGIPALMTAHVIFEALDPDHPATMSHAVVHGLLREALRYDGLIVSDDLEMRAIADHYDVAEVVVSGLNAGVDQFLCCHTAELAHRAIDAVIEAVERGRVSRETLAAANRRIEAFTARYAHPPPASRDLSVLRCEAHLALIERISRGADAADPTQVMDRVLAERG